MVGHIYIHFLDTLMCMFVYILALQNKNLHLLTKILCGECSTANHRSNHKNTVKHKSTNTYSYQKHLTLTTAYTKIQLFPFS